METNKRCMTQLLTTHRPFLPKPRLAPLLGNSLTIYQA